jgi:hypothetical protein
VESLLYKSAVEGERMSGLSLWVYIGVKAGR